MAHLKLLKQKSKSVQVPIELSNPLLDTNMNKGAVRLALVFNQAIF